MHASAHTGREAGRLHAEASRLPTSVFASVRDILGSPTVLTFDEENAVRSTTLLVHASGVSGDRFLRIAVGDEWPCDVELKEDRVVGLAVDFMVPSHRGPSWVTLITRSGHHAPAPSIHSLDVHSWTLTDSSLLSLPTVPGSFFGAGAIEKAVLHGGNGSSGAYGLAYRDGGGFEVDDWPVVAVVDPQGKVVGAPSPLSCCFPHHVYAYLPAPALASVDGGILLASAHGESCSYSAKWCVPQSVVVLHASPATGAAPQIRSVIPKVLPEPWFGSFDIAAADDHAWVAWSELANDPSYSMLPRGQTIFAARLTLEGELTMEPIVVAESREIMRQISVTATGFDAVLTWVEAISGEPNDEQRAARIVIQRLNHVSQLEPAVVLDAGSMSTDAWQSVPSVTSASRSLYVAWTAELLWAAERPIQLARLDCR